MFNYSRKEIELEDIRKSMEKRNDYMSMKLPRSFANTVNILLKDCKDNIDKSTSKKKF